MLLRYRSALLIFVISFLVYLPSLGNQFVWDDEQFIYRNVFVRDFNVKKIFTTNTIAGAGEISNYYRPLTTLSFAFDYQVWGLNPIGFHLVNTLLHASNAVLLYFLLRYLGLGKKGSFWLGVLFAIHPIQTEAVVYANSRGDSLFTFFGFLSLLGFSKILGGKNIHVSIYNIKTQIGSLTLSLLTITTYLFSILSKEIGITFVGLQVLIALRLLVLGKLKSGKKWVICTMIGSVFVASVYMLLRSTVLNFNNTFNFYGEGSAYASILVLRLATFTKVLWIYAQLLLAPFPLYMERDTELVTSFVSIWTAMTVIFLSTLAFLGWQELRRKKTVWIWFGLGWFFVTISPVSGLIPINGVLYEHWLYLPMVGFFITAIGVFKLFFERFLKNHYEITRNVFGIIVTIFILLTLRQNYLWGTPIRFYEHLLRYTESARTHNNLAMAYADDKQLEKSIEQYDAAIALADVYPQVHYNKGNTQLSLGKTDEAILSYKRSLELQPTFVLARYKLMEIYLGRQDKENLKIQLDLFHEFSGEVPAPLNKKIATLLES